LPRSKKDGQMVIEPKTWLDSEIIELMVQEAKEYRHDVQLKGKPVNYREMMECVLQVLEREHLIEHTP
jgi:hypothetical protein